MLDRLFVYGTLRPGGSRWEVLEDRVVSVSPGRARGALYRTPYGYPAARFDRTGSVVGDLLELEPDRLEEILERVDQIEGVDRGLFERVAVEVETPGGTVRAWAYRFLGPLEEAEPIPGGDWLSDRSAGL